MQILKFGGTSMGDEHTWRKVLAIVERYGHPFVIVSATARTTRQLLAAAEQALTNPEQAQHMASKIQKRHQELIGNFINNYPNAEPAIVWGGATISLKN